MLDSVDSTINTTDAWSIRIAVLFNASLNAYQLLKSIHGKMKTAPRGGMKEVLRQYAMMITLATMGLYCVFTFVCRPLFDNTWAQQRSWNCMMFIGHGLYTALETRISLSRIPEKLLNAEKWKNVQIMMWSGMLMSVLRATLSLVNTAMVWNLDDTQASMFQRSPLNQATTIFNMVGAGFFMYTELYIYLLSKDLESKSSKKVAQAMRLLGQANLYGSVAGAVDILSQYFQVQTIEAFVLYFGMTVFGFYAELLSVDYDTTANMSVSKSDLKRSGNILPSSQVDLKQKSSTSDQLQIISPAHSKSGSKQID